MITITKKYDFIDALRGFAILGVVMIHTSQWVPPSTYALLKLTHQGLRGVQLFFVASALTLFLSLNSRRKESRPILNFFLRRFFRIAPLFYLAIIVYTLSDCKHYYGNV